MQWQSANSSQKIFSNYSYLGSVLLQGYMIWKPKIDINSSDKKPYSAPSLLRHYNQNNWRTTTQTTYQNYFQDEETGKSRLMEQKQRDSGSKLSSRMETRVLSREQIEGK